jgi:exopolyphosphatase / guanosine-5'-triphosphate,3'-diphosphate pyrophosphatase
VTRVGVVDVGTNSTRLLVADVADGAVSELDRRLTITRLGEGVDAGRCLSEEAVNRVFDVLAEYRQAAAALAAEHVIAFATSAVRDAANREAFLAEIERRFGFATRLLSGDEEACLTFDGVASARSIAEATLVLDVGGGSTELVLGGPDGISFHVSLDLGCVRLRERYLAGDPPAEAELDACAEYVRGLLADRVPGTVRPSLAIGVAGTVTTLATLHLGLEQEDPEMVHGHVLETQWVASKLAELARMPIEGLRAQRGIHRDRAPVLVAGSIVVLETLRHFGIPVLEASERDIMDGAALLAAGSIEL